MDLGWIELETLSRATVARERGVKLSRHARRGKLFFPIAAAFLFSQRAALAGMLAAEVARAFQPVFPDFTNPSGWIVRATQNLLRARRPASFTRPYR